MQKEEWGIILVILLVVIVLTGCASTTVPVTMNFPQAPEPILLEPEKLDPLPEDAKAMTDLLENSTVNYGKHRELQMKYLQWQRWYDTNRRLHKETTKGE
jgi:PBP1b-binding outer membrane lipoprotein LpoB